MQKTNIYMLKEGSILSESSHYIVIAEPIGGAVSVKHIESNTVVRLGLDYVKDLIDSGDQFTHEVKVGKEDKLWTQKQIDAIIDIHDSQWCKDNNVVKGVTPRVGDIRVKGIRTIWESIHSQQVFTVCFKKTEKNKTKKAIKEEMDAQQQTAIALIDKAKQQKKSMAEAYKVALEFVQNNPIKDYIEGESRVLRGYKIQFNSRDGRYDCIDLDIDGTNGESSIRPVNINTIEYLIFDGVKYIVE